MDSLCKYSEIFGAPRTGAHAYRVFDLAIVDIVFTLLGAFFLKDYIKKSLIKTFIGLWIIGIVFHILFCVDTPITLIIKNLFL